MKLDDNFARDGLAHIPATVFMGRGACFARKGMVRHGMGFLTSLAGLASGRGLVGFARSCGQPCDKLPQTPGVAVLRCIAK